MQGFCLGDSIRSTPTDLASATVGRFIRCPQICQAAPCARAPVVCRLFLCFLRFAGPGCHLPCPLACCLVALSWFPCRALLLLLLLLLWWRMPSPFFATCRINLDFPRVEPCTGPSLGSPKRALSFHPASCSYANHQHATHARARLPRGHHRPSSLLACCRARCFALFLFLRVMFLVPETPDAGGWHVIFRLSGGHQKWGKREPENRRPGDHVAEHQSLNQ